MTKKNKQDSLSMLNRHHSERVAREEDHNYTQLSLKKHSHNKKSIKKPEQQLQIIQKVELLKEKSHRFYKHAQKKIDRMIQIVEEIQQQIINPYLKKHPLIQIQSTQTNNPAKKQEVEPQINLSAEQQELVSKTSMSLHNLLTYQKPLSHIKHQFQSFYSKLSAFSKEIQCEQMLSVDKKFLIPEKGLNFEQVKLIEQLIKQHYLRKGNFQAAKLFDRYGKQESKMLNSEEIGDKIKNCDQKEQLSMDIIKPKKEGQKSNTKKIKSIKSPNKTKPKVQLLDQKENFKECLSLRKQILSKKFQQAINWCVSQRLYETYSNPLQYDLRVAQIKELIFQKKYQTAFEKMRNNFQKFYTEYEEQINSLITFLLFSCSWEPKQLFKKDEDVEYANLKPFNKQEKLQHQKIVKERYFNFDIKTLNVQDIASALTDTYFIHYNISQFDTLKICYQVGKKYESKYFESINMFSERDRQDFLKHRSTCDLNDRHSNAPHPVLLPFQVPVDKQHMYHSIFVCPVTKEVLSSNDGVQFLSCGHLVSQSAKKKHGRSPKKQPQAQMPSLSERQSSRSNQSKVLKNFYRIKVFHLLNAHLTTCVCRIDRIVEFGL